MTEKPFPLSKDPGYSTHLITKHAVEFIEAHKEGPFCLYVAHEAVHGPWQGPDDPGFASGTSSPRLKRKLPNRCFAQKVS